VATELLSSIRESLCLESQISKVVKILFLKKKLQVFSTIQDDVSKQVFWFTSMSVKADTRKSCFPARAARKSHATPTVRLTFVSISITKSIF